MSSPREPSRRPLSTATARLFLALWPGPRLRASLVEYGDRWSWSPGTTRVSPLQLHLTLHFLGNVPVTRVPELRCRLTVPWKPFELRLGHPHLWRHGLAVLEPEDSPAPLLELHAALGSVLQSLGLPVETREFRPHVTLARRALHAVSPAVIPALRWRVRRYVLAESTAGEYRVLANYD